MTDTATRNLAASAHLTKTASNVRKTPIVLMMDSANAMRTGVAMTAQSTLVNVILFVKDAMDQILKTVKSALKTLMTYMVTVYV